MSTTDFSNIIEQDKDKVSIPDLDWLSLAKEGYDNIPTENPVEVIPQLQEAWTHTKENTTHFIPNAVSIVEKKASDSEMTAAVSDLVDYAKKQMMMGLNGKALASKLGGLFPSGLIKLAKDQLVKLAGEQHLLGNVYVDLSPFSTCQEAAKILGPNRVRLAKYVTGSPKKCSCTSHAGGYCKELKKKVVVSMEYTPELLTEYGKHLHIAGVISDPSTITSKETLQGAFVKTAVSHVYAAAKVAEEEKDPKDIKEAFAKEVEKSSSENEKDAAQRRFYDVRPILAYMQNQMLKGKTGDALKASIQANFSSHEIAKYAKEIQKVAGLQGLMGNVYVDISYYRDAAEATKAIKTASTSPLYIIQSMKKSAYDDSLLRVAKATGCSELPKDGKIDKAVVASYLTDLQFNNKVGSDTASTLRGRLEAGENPLTLVREGYIASTQYKPVKREGGVKAEVFVGTQKKSSDRDVLQGSVKKALDAGISIDKVEEKLASVISTAEAAGMVRNVLASLDEVDASCLPNCTKDRYHFKHEASLKLAAKCDDCILKGHMACTKLGLKFAGQKNLDKAYLDLDPKTAKVQFDENPDVSRIDMNQEYDMGDGFGSGMNIAMDNLRK